jgi:hypothetical protein
MFRSLLTFVLVLVLAPLALAQGPAGRKVTGEAYWQGATKQRHARDYGRVLNYSGRQSPTVARTTVQPNAQVIRQNTEAATKEFAKIKAQHADDKTVQSLVDSIEKHHAQVLAMCSMLDEECKKGDAGGAMVRQCCVTMAKELDAAAKDVEKLREALKIEPLGDPLTEEGSK